MNAPSLHEDLPELGDLNRQAQEHFARHCIEHGFIKPCPICAGPRCYWHEPIGWYRR